MPSHDSARRLATVTVGGASGWFIAFAVVALVGLIAVVLFHDVVPDRINVASAPRASAEGVGASDIAVPLKVGIIGDSYTAGETPEVAPFTWPQLLDVGYPLDIDNQAVRGTGFTTGGDGSFIGQAKRFDLHCGVVIVFGSRNDMRADPDATYANALAAYTAIVARVPHAKVVAVGPPWVDGNPPAEARADRDALARAAREAGIPFVDAMAEKWLVGKGLIGPDGVHPTAAGHAVLAERMGRIVAAYLPEAH